MSEQGSKLSVPLLLVVMCVVACHARGAKEEDAEVACATTIPNKCESEPCLDLIEPHLTKISRISINSSGEEANGVSSEPSISSDGRYIAFISVASNLEKNDTNGQRDVFIHDRLTGTTTGVVVNLTQGRKDGGSFDPDISGDGNLTVFTAASWRKPGDESDGYRYDLFEYDRGASTTTRLQIESSGTGRGITAEASMSDDGRTICFVSKETILGAGDTDEDMELNDVFLFERQTSTTTLASKDIDDELGYGLFPSVSSDGRIVVYLGGGIDPETRYDDHTYLYLFDKDNNESRRLDFGLPQLEGIHHPYFFDLSSDGRYIVLQPDILGVADVVVFDRLTNALLPVELDFPSTVSLSRPSISADGRFVAFETEVGASSREVVVYDLLKSHAFRFGSSASSGDAVESEEARISADGRFVVFSSDATDLVDGDENGVRDIFVAAIPQ